VYSEYVLLRTLLALEGREAIRVPDDVPDLIQRVYGAQGPDVPDVTEEIAERLDHARATWERERHDSESEANRRLVPVPDDPDLMVSTLDLEDEDARVHESLRALTRLTDPTVTVVCLSRERELVFCGGQPVDLDEPPSLAVVRRLLGRSMPVSRPKAVYRALSEAPPPPGWRRVAMLRHCREIVFDEDNRTTRGGHVLHLDPDVGLLIEKEPD
jgi:CRISPR-associated endonuclease/helicase Cas3